jgi:hypothetical protein
VEELDRPPAGRIADRDREAAIEVLCQAVADGRLTLGEYEERLPRMLTARTRQELDRFVAEVVPPAPLLPERVVAVGSKIVRGIASGRPVEANAVFGAALIDLSGLGARQTVEIAASSLCGKVLVCVSPGAMVIDEGVAVLGKRSVPGPPREPDGSVVRLTGRSVLGNLRVVRPDSVWAVHFRIASGHFPVPHQLHPGSW